MAISSYFRRHGQLCASHQWEVIVSIVTFTVCMLTVNERRVPLKWTDKSGCGLTKEYFGVDAVVMTAVRCIALLYTYHQFRKLCSLGSKYILGLAGLFTVISTAVFTSSIVNFMHSDLSDLKDALFFFLLLIDLSKVTRLAQYALASSNLNDVEGNIARGMEVLGPQMTLDVLVEVLLISVGTLSGVHRLEVLCCYACMSAVISYLMFMTFYPACLSLVLEMSSVSEADRQPWQLKSLANLLQEDEQKPNIVIQRVKIIMSIGLSFVHFVSRWPSAGTDDVDAVFGTPGDAASCNANIPSPYSVLLRWMSVSAEHLVVLIIVVALVVKYVLFEQADNEQLRLSVEADDRDWLLRRQRLRRCTSIMITQDSDGKVKVNELSPPASSADAGSQTQSAEPPQAELAAASEPRQPRHVDECSRVLEEEGPEALSDAELLVLLRSRRLRAYQLETRLGDPHRAVDVRRQHVGELGDLQPALDDVPFKGYEYERVMGACCENVVGYVPLPLGVVGPLQLDGRPFYVPLATTEGALVASTNRGCVATRKCGINSYIVGDGMTRAPVIECQSAKEASEILHHLETPEGFRAVKEAFDSTSRFARLKNVEVSMFGRQLFVRFVARTGDAMGMNMVSKGTEKALEHLKALFPQMVVTSVSSNVCTDKKPSAINWIRGRGKSVICEAVVPADVVSSVLKTTVPAMVNLCIKKNLIGSAVAGSIGGNNAHAANVVSAIFIATGQDPAQNVCSSNCMTLLEPCGENGEDLYITCTMPSLEVGTVGGGTILKAQRACLRMLGCQGASAHQPGDSARQLASVVCATVLAGELSLMAAQSAGHLVKSHMILNRNATR